MNTFNNTIDTQETITTIEVMRRQEESAYTISDYLQQIPQVMNGPLHETVDPTCRRLMAQWCNQIADFCCYQRETVSIAMSCLDRFLSTREGQSVLLDRDQYQLAVMTSLYTAIKVHEKEAMDPMLVSNLSRGAHSPEAIEAMESKILNAIKWRVNPPTSYSFVQQILSLVPVELLGHLERENVMEMIRLQLEVATIEYDFTTVHASTIAYASILNAIESISTDEMYIARFEYMMNQVLRIPLEGIHAIRIKLYEAINKFSGTEPVKLQSSSTTTESKTYSNSTSYHCSPRSVSTSLSV